MVYFGNLCLLNLALDKEGGIKGEGLKSPLKTNSADSLLTSSFFLLFSSFHSV